MRLITFGGRKVIFEFPKNPRGWLVSLREPRKCWGTDILMSY